MVEVEVVLQQSLLLMELVEEVLEVQQVLQQEEEEAGR